MSDNIARTRAAILGINNDPVGTRRSTSHMPVTKNVSFFAKGGAVNFFSKGKKKFEGSKKDKSEDSKLAKKYDMSLKGWESSKKDAKHDKQKSMKGFANGGEVKNVPGPDWKRETMTVTGRKPDAMSKPEMKVAKTDAPKVGMPEMKQAKSGFGAAFKAARDSGVKTFEFNGKKYTTRRADETPEQFNNYFNGKEAPRRDAGPDPMIADLERREALQKKVETDVASNNYAKGGDVSLRGNLRGQSVTASKGNVAVE